MNSSLKEKTFYLLHDEKVMCAAVSVIWTMENEILMIKRAEREGDPWSGHIGFPGGRLEESDNGNPFLTAVRETKEEVGVELTSQNCLRQLTTLLPEKDFRGFKLELWPYLFRLEKPISLNLDKNEVQEIVTVPVEMVTKKFNLKEGEFSLLSGESYHLPYLELPSGDKVWGLSLMILREMNQLYS